MYVIDSGNNRLTKFVPTEEELSRGREQVQTEQALDLTTPTNLAVKAGDTENVISWLDVPGAVSYNLYFSTNPGLTTEIATKIEGVTSPYTHTGLTNNTPYFYVLTAVTEEGAESSTSEEHTATPVLIEYHRSTKSGYCLKPRGVYDQLRRLGGHDFRQGFGYGRRSLFHFRKPHDT